MENVSGPAPNAKIAACVGTQDPSPPDKKPDTPSVLTEKNVEGKLVSPVLFRLRQQGERKVTTPNPVDPVKVPPKKFAGFPADRYTSPTDSVMSPISRGLLARSKRFRKPQQVSVPPKILGDTFQEAESSCSIST